MVSRAIQSFRFFLTLSFFFASVAPAQEYLNGVVVSDQSWATRAGMELLEQGGNAVDAAVATAFALSVVDPASGGLGGGGFMVLYESEAKKAHLLDFLEISPAASRLALYREDGRFERQRLLSGGLAVAVPGTVAGLLEALKRFGSLPLEVVLAPAVRYAESGFPVSPRLWQTVQDNVETLDRNPDFRRIFIGKDGKPYSVGQMIRQPELAESLKRIANQGARAFYQGVIGQAIVATVKEAGGVLDADDLKSYKALWRRPLIGDYRGTVVITVPPPSSGGIALLEALKVLEGYALRQLPHNAPAYLHLLAEVLQVATRDRLERVGDPGFTQVPEQLLASKEHAVALRSKISAMEQARKGAGFGNLHTDGEGGTSHLAVLDGDGNIAAMGLTINEPFGAKLLVREAGIILNNSMARFTIPAHGDPAAADSLPNGLEPRKRPVSTLMPTILLEHDVPVLVVGASRTSSSTSTVLQTILNTLDFEMPLEQALATVRLNMREDSTPVVSVETRLSERVATGLAAKGQSVQKRQPLGSVQAIRVDGPAIIARADLACP